VLAEIGHSHSENRPLTWKAQKKEVAYDQTFGCAGHDDERVSGAHLFRLRSRARIK
jgi:hypothetical protein